MKFKVTMKDPDTLWDAIQDAVRNDQSINAADDEELKMVREHRIERAMNASGRWFRYGEYLTVEIDTDAETCTVIPVK